MQYVTKRFLNYHERHRIPLELRQESWTYDLGPNNLKGAPTHGPAPQGSTERPALLPTVRFEMSGFAKRQKAAVRSGVEVGYLTGGHIEVPPEILKIQRDMERSATVDPRQDAKLLLAKKKQHMHPALRAIVRHLEEKKMFLKAEEMNKEHKADAYSALDNFQRTTAVNALTHAIDSRWEDYLEDGLFEIYQNNLTKQRLDIAKAALLGDAAAEAEEEAPPETDFSAGKSKDKKSVDIDQPIFDPFDVPAGRTGFKQTGIKSLVELDAKLDDKRVYPTYRHIFTGKCDIIFDFEVRKPVVRDVVPGTRSVRMRPPIERGHRLVKVNAKETEDMTYEEIMDELDVRPLMLEFEKRPPRVAATDIAIRNETNANVLGLAELRRRKEPPEFPDKMEVDFARDFVSRPRRKAQLRQEAAARMADVADEIGVLPPSR